ncbi:MAG: glycosyltransferase family 39 protein [Patescibacteria group bacterium]|nr:glycosyltransferase family 39 protein [Patescibacteria group bacterium]
MKKFKWDFLCLLLLTLLTPLFFYKLGQSSLGSWDEAWYADTARTVVKTGDLFHLKFNGNPFFEHPPGGIWITAVVFKLFGISEFTDRLPSAVLGIFSLYLMYFLGKTLFNRVVGFSSALALCSSFWFLSRARSGNLDIPLTFFLLLTLYLALRASKNRRFFVPFFISLAFTVSIKSLLPFAILPALLMIFWKNKIYKLKDYLLAFAAMLSIYITWVIVQYFDNPFLVQRHFFHSLRGSSVGNNFLNSFQLFYTYLHNGIGKWYWPGLAGILTGLILRQKRFLILIVFFISYAVPFLFSKELQIWHLIPLHRLMILLFFGTAYVVILKVSVKLNIQKLSALTGLLILAFSFYYSFIQLRAAWYQFIDIPRYISDEDILSRQAAKYEGRIILDGDFDPAGAFYSGRVVRKLSEPSMKKFFETDNNFLLITNTWRLDGVIDPKDYEVLWHDRDKVLVRKR